MASKASARVGIPAIGLHTTRGQPGNANMQAPAPRTRPKTRLDNKLEAKKTADMPRARPKARHKNIPDQVTPLQEAPTDASATV